MLLTVFFYYILDISSKPLLKKYSNITYKNLNNLEDNTLHSFIQNCFIGRNDLTYLSNSIHPLLIIIDERITPITFRPVIFFKCTVKNILLFYNTI